MEVTVPMAWHHVTSTGITEAIRGRLCVPTLLRGTLRLGQVHSQNSIEQKKGLTRAMAISPSISSQIHIPGEEVTGGTGCETALGGHRLSGKGTAQGQFCNPPQEQTLEPENSRAGRTARPHPGEAWGLTPPCNTHSKRAPC